MGFVTCHLFTIVAYSALSLMLNLLVCVHPVEISCGCIFTIAELDISV
jgi:hypothetical protein